LNITDKKLRETIVSIPDGDRNRIFIIIGSAGMGKSFLLNYGEDDTKILKKLWRDTVKDVVAQNLADLRAKSPDFVVKDIKWPSLRAALIQCIKDVQASAVVATDEANMIDRRPMDDVSSLNAKMDILFEEWRSRPWELSSSDQLHTNRYLLKEDCIGN